MKKNLWLAALVGVALTGCVNEEVAPEAMQKDVLTFSAPVMAIQSRAANFVGEIKGTEYPAKENFRVYCKTYEGKYAGWAAYDEKTGKGTTGFSDYFNAGGEIAKNNPNVGTGGSGNYWATDAVHYWPEIQYNLAFAAYSPAELTTAPTSIEYTEEGLQIKGFKTETDANNQYDLMYSHIKVGLNKNSANSAVPLVFNHALSSIVFSSQKSNTDVDYKITSVVLEGSFVQEADFNQGITGQTNSEKVYSETENPVWTNLKPATAKQSYSPKFTEFSVPVESPAQFTEGASALLLIPQDVPEDANVILSYKKITYPDPSNKEKFAELPATATIPLASFTQVLNDPDNPPTNNDGKITKWERGKRYVYRISFGKNSRIYFHPTIVDWIQEPTLIYTIQ